MPVFHKLVRDKIPAIILAKGEHCISRPLRDDEKDSALDTKLCEETLELIAARDLPQSDAGRREKVVHEFADVFEVLSALLRRVGILLDEVRAKARDLREARGGFDDFILLEKAEPVR